MLDRVIQINQKKLSIVQDLSLSHAGTVWDGALCMIAFFNKNVQIAKQYLQNKNVLELGSGTGILGLACSLFKPNKLYMTDYPQYLKLLQDNLQKNQKIINKDSLLICPLQWGNIDHMSKIREINTIIGSQLAYDEKCLVQLIKTLKYYKQQNEKLKIIITYQKYKQQGRNLQRQFQKHLGKQNYKLIQWDLMDPQMRDQGIGIINLIG